MGRHHALKPHHLYLTPPSHSPDTFQLLKSSYASPATLITSSPFTALSVGDRIPGFKVSAAFLSSLQSNIFIELDSNYDSPEDSPYSLRPSIINYPPSPLVHDMSSLTSADVAPPDVLRLPDHATLEVEEQEPKEPTVGEDGLPILTSFAADNDDARAEALHIVADTVAQQRNIASRSLIFHPIVLAVFVAGFGACRQYFYRGENSDYIKILTTFTGVVMAILGGVRLTCGPYIFEAERVGTWRWLDKGRSAEEEEQTGVKVLGQTDEILLTKFGNDYIGTIIFRGVQPVAAPGSPSGNKKTRKLHSPSKHTKMVIRGWSVRQKYRRKEVGSALLEDAIRLGKEKGWTTDGVEFADDHANHKRVLPAIFNGALDKYNQIAQKTLEKKVHEIEAAEGKGKKKR